MSPYKHLVIATLNGHYTFRSDLNQEENCNLYAITCQSIDKSIVASIIMGEPELSKTVDRMILWTRHGFQLLEKDLEYLAQKMILTELESMSKNQKKRMGIFGAFLQGTYLVTQSGLIRWYNSGSTT